MDKEPHRREPSEYAPPGQEYAQPGRECANPGREQQGERTRANDYASPRQEKKRSEREKLLRTLMLSTATVAVAAAVVVTPEPKPKAWGGKWIVTGMSHIEGPDDGIILITNYEFKRIDNEDYGVGWLDTSYNFHDLTPDDMVELVEVEMEEHRRGLYPEGTDSILYPHNDEGLPMDNPKPSWSTEYDLSEQGTDEFNWDYLGFGENADGTDNDTQTIRRWIIFGPDSSDIIAKDVYYPKGNSYYRDEYQYNVTTGEFKQTVEGEWIADVDERHFTDPVSEDVYKHYFAQRDYEDSLSPEEQLEFADYLNSLSSLGPGAQTEFLDEIVNQQNDARNQRLAANAEK